jgi:hypothetical protein
MTRNPLGWHYPPGAEHDPNAPYNQKPAIPEEDITGAVNCANLLWDMLKDLEDIDDSWFSLYQPLGKVFGHLQAVINALEEVQGRIRDGE